MLDSEKGKDKSIDVILVDRSAKMHYELIQKALNVCGTNGNIYNITPIEWIDKGLNWMDDKLPDIAIVGLANKLNQDLNSINYWGLTTKEKVEDGEYPGEVLIKKCIIKGLPFVIFSGHEWAKEEMLDKYNAKYFIPKPFKLDSAVKTIEDALYNR